MQLNDILQKADERRESRDEAGLAHPNWDFLFEPGYQSTDESVQGNGLDSDTELDSNDENATAMTTKPWTSFPHTHRSEIVC